MIYDITTISTARFGVHKVDNMVKSTWCSPNLITLNPVCLFYDIIIVIIHNSN